MGIFNPSLLIITFCHQELGLQLITIKFHISLWLKLEYSCTSVLNIHYSASHITLIGHMSEITQFKCFKSKSWSNWFMNLLMAGYWLTVSELYIQDQYWQHKIKPIQLVLQNVTKHLNIVTMLTRYRLLSVTHEEAALCSLDSVWVPWGHCQQGQTSKVSIPMLEMFMLLLFFLSGWFFLCFRSHFGISQLMLNPADYHH